MIRCRTITFTKDLEWNDDNAPTEGNFSGTPTTQSVSQLDASLGGPIVRDKMWFFGSFRLTDLENGIGRTARQLAILESFSGMPLGGGRGTVPDFEPFQNGTDGFQPYLKLTAQLSPNHELSAYYKRDNESRMGATDSDYEPYAYTHSQGQLVGGKVTSVFVQLMDKSLQSDALSGAFSAAINQIEDWDLPEIRPYGWYY